MTTCNPTIYQKVVSKVLARLRIAGKIRIGDIWLCCNGMGLSYHTIRYAARIIMDNLVQVQAAEKIVNGCWIIHDPKFDAKQLFRGQAIIEMAEKVRDVRDYSFLDPPLHDPRPDMAKEIRKMPACQFEENVLRLCEENQVSIKAFLNYMQH